MNAEKVVRIVRSNPGKQICLKPSPGVSSWLTSADVAVTRHKVLQASDDGTQLRVSAVLARARNGSMHSSIDLLRCDESIDIATMESISFVGSAAIMSSLSLTWRYLAGGKMLARSS